MRLLLSYLSRHKIYIVMSLGLTVISQVFNFLNPYFLGTLLIDPFAAKAEFFRNNGLDSEYLMGIAKGMAIIATSSAVSWITRAYRDYAVNIVIQKFGTQLYLDVQNHNLSLPFQDFEDQRSGEVFSGLQRARTDSQTFITKFIHVLFSAVIGILVVSVVAFEINPWLPLAYLAAVFFLCWFTNILTKKVKSIQTEVLKDSAELAGSSTESIRNIELIKGLGLVEREIQRLSAITNRVLLNELRKIKRLRSISMGYGAFIHTIHQLVLIALLLSVFYNDMTVGQVLMMQVYFYYIFGTLEELESVVVSFQETQGSLNNLNELLKRKVEIVPVNATEVSSISTLKFEDVSFRHTSALNLALENVSFEVKRGETVAIVGPSGAGKSTIVKLLVGLYKPTHGTVYCNDQKLDSFDPNQFRSKIGMVTQDTQLFSGTVRENLLFVNPNANEEMLNDALKFSSCDEFVLRSPHGMDTQIGESGLRVSGGERQRLSLARALIRDADLLIFDEATSSLDSMTEAEVSLTIQRIIDRRRYITVMVAHRLSSIMFADRIIVLENGRVVETGSHRELVENKGLYAAMWRQQTGEKRKMISGIDETEL